MKQDDEFHEVGVGLLPEGFFALPEQVIQEGGDAVGQRIGIQIVVERIVPVGRIEADLDVILAAPGSFRGSV